MTPDAPWAKEIRASWWFLLRMQSALHHGLHGGIYDQPRPVTADFESACYGLLLVQAYGALESALRHLRDEGVFTSNASGLERLMSASRTYLPWIDYLFVDEGRQYRNSLVHEMTTARGFNVLAYVRAVQEELASWASLSAEEAR